MTYKRLGHIFFSIGIALFSLSIVIDYIGVGKGGIQAAQLLGILLGLVIGLIGTGFIFSPNQSKINISFSLQAALRRVLNLPPFTWVLIGFLFIFIIWFIFPMFFNDLHRMKYFLRYIPDKVPLGSDFKYNTDAIRLWFSGGNIYDQEIHFYPPLYAVVFAPTLLLSYPASYFFISSITLICFALPFLLFRSTAKRNYSYFSFFLLTGLISYGTQFELERGQFNIIAVTLCFLSIYLFHRHYSFRYLAYFLFSISAQIKLYPAIFIFLFIKDWRDWKGNLLRFAGLGVFNIALLFVLGYDTFLEFLKKLRFFLGDIYLFPGNHSIKAYTYNLTHYGFGLFSTSTQNWLTEHASVIQSTFYLWFIICFGIILFNAYKRNHSGINFNLILACTTIAMLLPSISLDYKLSLLAAPLAFVLSIMHPVEGTKWKILSILSILLLSVSYSATLIPYIYRPEHLQSSMPFILTILTALAILDSIPTKETQLLSGQSLQ